MMKKIFLVMAVCICVMPLFAEEYRLKPEDTLDIRIMGRSDLNSVQSLTPDGTVVLPMVGRTKVLGKTLYEVDALLKEGVAKYVQAPQVMVILRPANVTVKPQPAVYYVALHNLKNDTWEIKTAKSKDEALAWTLGRPFSVLSPTLAPSASTPSSSYMGASVTPLHPASLAGVPAPALAVYDGAIPTGSTLVISMNKKPDFWEDNWTKVVSATSLLVGIFLSLRH